MRWIAAASLMLVGFGAEARAETAAPVEVNCAPASRAQLEVGRPIRCEVALDLRGEPLGPRTEPEVVQVPGQPLLRRKRLPQVVEPAAPRALGFWSGTAVLRAQAPEPACAGLDPGHAIFPKAPLSARRGVLPVVEELQPAACPERG